MKQLPSFFSQLPECGTICYLIFGLLAFLLIGVAGLLLSASVNSPRRLHQLNE